jgi:hypothetical protein
MYSATSVPLGRILLAYADDLPKGGDVEAGETGFLVNLVDLLRQNPGPAEAPWKTRAGARVRQTRANLTQQANTGRGGVERFIEAAHQVQADQT